MGVTEKVSAADACTRIGWEPRARESSTRLVAQGRAREIANAMADALEDILRSERELATEA